MRRLNFLHRFEKKCGLAISSSAHLPFDYGGGIFEATPTAGGRWRSLDPPPISLKALHPLHHSPIRAPGARCTRASEFVVEGPETCAQRLLLKRILLVAIASRAHATLLKDAEQVRDALARGFWPQRGRDAGNGCASCARYGRSICSAAFPLVRAAARRRRPGDAESAAGHEEDVNSRSRVASRKEEGRREEGGVSRWNLVGEASLRHHNGRRRGHDLGVGIGTARWWGWRKRTGDARAAAVVKGIVARAKTEQGNQDTTGSAHSCSGASSPSRQQNPERSAHTPVCARGKRGQTEDQRTTQMKGRSHAIPAGDTRTMRVRRSGARRKLARATTPRCRVRARVEACAAALQTKQLGHGRITPWGKHHLHLSAQMNQVRATSSRRRATAMYQLPRRPFKPRAAGNKCSRLESSRRNDGGRAPLPCTPRLPCARFRPRRAPLRSTVRAASDPASVRYALMVNPTGTRAATPSTSDLLVRPSTGPSPAISMSGASVNSTAAREVPGGGVERRRC
ncbi:hypothetical protein B0H17DRAFT_1187186 [Mycena rosella]|uniref:Uncharacterized protein n=1 Tax=Mycena rosella TaxID=1033263 RepID=A0AAD7FS98_MYCRO|nr:hypothetical protein B0H17DRAFT_1187186 [Mycena rosella]